MSITFILQATSVTISEKGWVYTANTHSKPIKSKLHTIQAIKSINATLPMLLRILDKKGADNILVQLGNSSLKRKATKNFKLAQIIGKNASQGKDGLLISDLIKQPKMLENSAHAKLKLSSNKKELLVKTHKGGSTLQFSFLKSFY